MNWFTGFLSMPELCPQCGYPMELGSRAKRGEPKVCAVCLDELRKLAGRGALTSTTRENTCHSTSPVTSWSYIPDTARRA